jgi:hypothetical protein
MYPQISLATQAGKVKPDQAIGHLLADTVASVPKMDASQLKAVFADSQQVCEPTLNVWR